VREDYLLADYTGDDADSANLLKRLMMADVTVESFYKEKGNLESLFLELTDEKALEKETAHNEADGFGGEKE
jgi:ABC-2 type transport system ATP-binding protein